MSRKFQLILGGIFVSLLLIVGVSIAYADTTPKLDVCHYDADLDIYFKIKINENALLAHLDHGDGLPGEPIPTMDGYIFGENCEPLIVYSFELSGVTFQDTYADSIKDTSEVDPGLSDWTIDIVIDEGPDGTPVNGTATTDENGSWAWISPEYAFPIESPPELSLTICVDLQDGWTQSFPVGDCYNLTFTPNTGTIPQVLMPYDFGYWQPVSVTACKLRDADGNLATTTDQTPLESWQISRTEAEVVVDMQSTFADGCYTWEDLLPGVTYGVQEEERAGWDALGSTEVMFEKASSGQSYSHTFINQDNIPVIVLPGLLASKLYNKTFNLFTCPLTGEVWPGYFLNWFELPLNEDGITSVCDIQADASQDFYGVLNTYGTLINFLEDEGYTVRFFPYDWRRDLISTAEQLNTQIDAWGYKKVYLVAHSMGGLLARTYIENADYAAKVEQVITIGSPYLGAPTLAMNMRGGVAPCPPACVEFGGLTIGVSSNNVYKLIRNSPAMMELLPSPAYFDRGNLIGLDHYFEDDGAPLTSLDATHYFFKSDYGMYGTQNGSLLDNAVAYHSIYDDFSEISVDYHVISAENKLTPLIFNEQFIVPWSIYVGESTVYQYGDGTVPVNSATYLGESSDKVHIYPPYVSSELVEDHQYMPSAQIVLDKIKEILTGTSSVSVQLLDMADTTPPAYLKLFVIGTTKVSISDGTHYIGFDQNGNFINDIPEATYQAFNYQTEVVLPSDRTYIVTIEQVGDIPIQLKVSELTAPSYEGLFTPSYQVAFQDIPLSMNGVATMSLDLAAGLDTLRLSIFNTGQSEQIIQPSSVLDLK